MMQNVEQYGELADEIRYLDDKKTGYSWAAMKGFGRELFNEGLAPIALFTAIGAAVGTVAFLGSLVLAGLEVAGVTALGAEIILPVAGMTAIGTALVIGGRGVFEDVNLARLKNAKLDREIGDAQLKAIHKSQNNGKESEAEIDYEVENRTRDPFINAVGGVAREDMLAKSDVPDNVTLAANNKLDGKVDNYKEHEFTVH